MLEVKNLCSGYDNTAVIRGVSLAVPPGRVVALLGANGAGKTTLLRSMCGVLRSTDGQIVLDGEDVTGMAPHNLVAKGVCHIPEGRGVFPHLTVRENLSLQSGRRANRDIIDRAIEAFPTLGSRLSQAAGTMSGGEQQMLAMTRAYVSDPRYVLLDEVSMGLAPLVVDQLFDFLSVLAERGAAVVCQS